MFKNRNIYYIHFDVLDSTNTWTKKNAETLDPQQITCIIAAKQTAGRGRGGKKWLSPDGENIYATLYFTLPKDTNIVSNLAQILSLSCVKVLQKMGFFPKIKWPNDLLLSDKKFSGILCETISFPDYIGIILGIGINLNMTEELLNLIDQPAISLAQLSGQTWKREQILSPLIEQFLKDLQVLQKKGFASFHKEYEELLAFKGQEITCNDGAKNHKGILQSVNKEGRLELLLPSGEIKVLSAGDIIRHY